MFTKGPVFFALLMVGAIFEPLLGAQKLGLVPAGAEAKLEFYKAPEFTLGEPIELTFVLRNLGPLPLKAQTGGDYRGTGFPTRYKFEVVDDSGTKAEPTAWFDMGGIIGAPHEVIPLREYREKLLLQNYVRIDHPGEYRVKVHHDFGWEATPERPYPVAEARIKVNLPTPEEASRQVQELVRTSKGSPPQSLGQYWNRPPFVWMIHPIYLPALEQAAAGGCEEAFEGIHRIRNTDATRAMVNLLQSDEPRVASAAALFLAKRLPVPNWKERPLRTLNGAFTPGGEMELYVHRFWVPELDTTVLAAARKMIARRGSEEIGRAAPLLGRLGEPSDAELVIQALDRVAQTSKDRMEPKGETYLPAAQGPALLSALEDLQTRGWSFNFPQGGEPPASGRLWAGLWLMASAKFPERPSFPAAGESLLAPGLASPYAVVREAALRALPEAAPERWRDSIKSALGDADLGVRHAAVHATLGTRDSRFEEPLLKLVRENPESSLTRDASDALIYLGARWQMTRAWVEALGEESRFSEALVFLLAQLVLPEGARLQRTSAIPAEETGQIQHAWKRLLDDPATEAHLRAGNRIPVSDAVMMELGGRHREWLLPDGRVWPQAVPR